MDDEFYRSRLLIYSAVRLVGVIIFFIGLAIIYTDLVRSGGMPRLGAVIAIVGALDALLTPHLLKKLWDKQDAGAE